MNPQAPAQPPVPVPPPAPAVTKPVPNPKSHILVNFLLLLAGIIIGAGGYWGYQNFLQKTVVEATPTPIVTSTPTTAPDDETVNWKEYSAKDYKLTFKAPYEMNVDISGSTITIQDYPLNAPPPDNYYQAVITISKTGVVETEADKKQQETTDKILATFVFEDGCIITGCNREICQETKAEATMTVCLWKEEYNCYKTAKCEVQTDGQCAWTQTTELKNCLQKYQ